LKNTPLYYVAWWRIRTGRLHIHQARRYYRTYGSARDVWLRRQGYTELLQTMFLLNLGILLIALWTGLRHCSLHFTHSSQWSILFRVLVTTNRSTQSLLSLLWLVFTR
jgi:hypothetical protein